MSDERTAAPATDPFVAAALEEDGMPVTAVGDGGRREVLTPPSARMSAHDDKRRRVVLTVDRVTITIEAVELTPAELVGLLQRVTSVVESAPELKAGRH